MEPAVFRVAQSVRLPGLGLLALLDPPAPGWLAMPALHTALPLRLHRAGHPPLPLTATIEELSRPGQPPVRALLLEADPDGELGTDAWLEAVPAPELTAGA